MTPQLERLGKALAEMHESFPEGDKTTAVHLFGIKYGEELLQLTRGELDRISEAAGLTPTYGLELRKMAKLSRYVTAI